MNESSREAEQWQRVKSFIGNEEVTLGPYFSFIVRKSPRRLLHLLSYYKFAAKMIGAGKRVLDVGCSEGFGTILLAEAAASCLGADIDAAAIAVANASVASDKLRFAEMDILTADPGRFDAVVTLDVIEHIFQENEDAFVARLASVLDPHGILIVGTPNISSDQYASPQSREGHVNLFTAERLRDLGLRHFHNVFSFSANDEMVHTGFSPLAHYLLALCVDPKTAVKRAFVDYYSERNISPVKQDISDRDRHFGRRASLYRFLAIPPLYVEGARVLEFGPGSGDNALYTASLGPERYVLVDGNPRGVEETRAVMATTGLPASSVSVVQSYVEDFATGERFDLVLAEGLIPFQNEPDGFTRHIASFVRPGGVLVITCADSASAIGEIGRRLLANRIASPKLPYAERRACLAPVFAPHLATLEGMSRSVEDWVDDNIAQPLTGKLYSIVDAIESLDGDGFVVSGSSPQFLTDWRWYKRVFGQERRFNERAVESYYRNVANFLDYRETLDAHDVELGRRIRRATDALHAAMLADDAGDPGALARATEHLDEIAGLVATVSAGTATSLRALATALAGDDGAAAAPNAFNSHFGRGQQYLSFVREP